MLYGIDQNVLSSPYSLIVSIILCIGLTNFGYLVQKFFLNRLINIRFEKNYIYFSPLVGVYTILFPLYLSLIFEFNFQYIVKIVSFLLLFSAFILILKIKILNSIKYIFKKRSIDIYTIILIFFFLFLISASPITHSDSIDYHFIGALDLINNGHLSKEILPMHKNLVSVGEIIIAIGLSLKAEQFGGIMQYLSLFSLIPLFTNEKLKKNLLLLILICPITFFLVSSPKPQLLFSISSLLIFVFLTEKANKLNLKQLKIIFPLVILILAINSLAKYSFYLSSTLLGIYFLFINFKKKLFLYSITSIVLIFSITILPHWLFRYLHYGTQFIDLVSSPLPINIYGYNGLQNLVTSGSISGFSIFFPKSLKEFSTSYGPLLLLLPLIINSKILKNKLPILILLIFFVSVIVFGGVLPRFLFEGFLWLVYLVSKYPRYNVFSYKILPRLIYIQLVPILMIYSFFVVSIFPGSLTQNFKDKVMRQNANGYELSQWTNDKLDEKDILLTTHRSLSLFSNKTYATIFTWYVKPDNKNSIQYFDFLKSKKINRILFYGEVLDKDIFEKCLGKELHYKKNVGRHVGRNPLNAKNYYNGWIYEFNYAQLPNCLF